MNLPNNKPGYQRFIQMELGIDVRNVPVPPAMVSETDIKMLKLLRKRVFVFDSSAADEAYFKRRITDYLLNNTHDTLTAAMEDAVWKVNQEVKTCKYKYFNERIQRLYLDRDFFSWAKIMCRILNEQLAAMESGGDKK